MTTYKTRVITSTNTYKYLDELQGNLLKLINENRMDAKILLSAVLPSEFMLEILADRGGHPGALAEAGLLAIKKAKDYNHGQVDIHKIDRSSYFPFGWMSFVQMLHTKVQRLVSLAEKERTGGSSSFESMEDTCLDLINYAGFAVAWAKEKRK